MRQETAEPTTRAIVLREGMREEQQAARNGKSAIQGERTLPDAAAHDLQAVGTPALDRLDHEEAKSVAASNAPLARVRRATARGMRWLEARTFAPRWLPPAWQQPLSGYAIATLLQLSASLATLLLPLLVPTFSFVGLLELLVVAVVAVLWGAGPSIFATLLGAVLLEWLVLPLGYGKHYAHPTDLIEIGWFLLVGLALGAVAGQTEKARRRAVEEQAEAHARELALRELGQRTDEFLSLASHELRTPLTGIKATLQLTQRRLQRLSNQRMSNHGPDQAALTSEQLTAQLAPLLEVLAGAQEQVDRENRLIGDLLDVSRIRANKLECRFAPVDLAVIVQAMVAEQRVAWPARTITLEGAEQPAPVSADPDRIAQVVTNFLTNALKYSPSGRPVTVAVRREGQRVRVLVQDQGQGLSPEQQRHIWERFHRVPGITQQSGSGTGLGLGLYIVRSIVERHGGEVDVVSAAGQGSTFSFVLPLAPGT